MKQTKIVASVSDLRCDQDFIRKLFFAGMNVVRMNTAHATPDGLRKIISNVRQVKARGGTVVAIITKGNDTMKDIADHCIEVPDVPECLTPIVVSVPLQLMAYYIAMNKGRNVDQPRNLAKSVTVE